MRRAALPRWAPWTARADARSCGLGLLDVGLAGLAHGGGEDLLHAGTGVDRPALALGAVEGREGGIDAQLGPHGRGPLQQTLGCRGRGEALAAIEVEQRPVLPEADRAQEVRLAKTPRRVVKGTPSSMSRSACATEATMSPLRASDSAAV